MGKFEETNLKELKRKFFVMYFKDAKQIVV